MTENLLSCKCAPGYYQQVPRVLSTRIRMMRGSRSAELKARPAETVRMPHSVLAATSTTTCVQLMTSNAHGAFCVPASRGSRSSNAAIRAGPISHKDPRCTTTPITEHPGPFHWPPIHNPCISKCVVHRRVFKTSRTLTRCRPILEGSPMSSTTKTFALHRPPSVEPCTAVKQTSVFEMAPCSHVAGFHATHQWLDEATGEVLVEWPNVSAAIAPAEPSRRAA